MDYESFYLYSTEELQPNSQGCIFKESNSVLSHTQSANQGRKVSFNENVSTYVLLITFIEKQPSVEPLLINKEVLKMIDSFFFYIRAMTNNS